MGRPKKYSTDEERRAANAERERKRRAAFTTEQKEHQLRQQATAKRQRTQVESEEERSMRLQLENRSQQRRRDKESEEKRTERLLAMSRNQQIRTEIELEADRNVRLATMSQNQRLRLETETVQDREARLTTNSLNHQLRLEGENEEEKRRRLELRRERISRKKLNYLQKQARDMLEDENIVEEHSCGPMNLACGSCSALHFQAEMASDKEFTMCCHKGLVKLPEQTYPSFLQDLMMGTSDYSKNFMDNIRSINSSFAFASMGANIAAPPGHGPYCFRIHGQIYHRTGTLHPEDGKERKFAQLYILDPTEATEERLRLQQNKNCNPNLMLEIASLMNDKNPFAKSYKMLKDVEQEAAEVAERNGTTMPKILMAIKQDRRQDPRRYNNPRVNEVAVVFENNDGEPPFNRDILIHLKPNPSNPLASKTKRITLLHSNLDALVYPILYPLGEQGWHDQIPHTKGTRKVTQLQYYSYLLSARNDFNPVLNGGKLTQQFIVDAYVKIEANRLNYIKTHQKELRREDYTALNQALQDQSRHQGVPLGQTVLLPSSFLGSPRNMQQRYQDAMAIVTKFGKPDLFITMTCNPKWKDITANIHKWQKVEHRSEMVARVFHIKLESLLKDIYIGLFGYTAAMIHVIEFQKRGLPHAHILVILDKKSKLDTEEKIDNVVWAEIPDAEKYPVLHEIVTKNMIHGPCGEHNSQCQCMEAGKCVKNFPKKFTDSTLGNVNGYPQYRRRNNIQLEKNGRTIDNSWVVPYNPYLLKKYNCHINVEVCASIKSVKYLFKYVYKGHDAANVVLKENALAHDEPENFVDSRYVSAPEACWRIFSFPMHKQSHVVKRLDVHLPGTQQIYFNEEDEADRLQDKLNRTSTLLEWFTLNSKDELARNYSYLEIPEHYVFNKDNKMWQRRQRGGEKTIGRMYPVAPTVVDKERYFLRLLLLHVKGATSFEHLRTVNGIAHPTFKDTARALGLLLDDSVWKSTLEDAIGLSMPSKLRDLFAYICVFGPPNDPSKLWAEFKNDLMEDYCHYCHPNEDNCQNCEGYAMKDVNDVLVLHGLSYMSFNPPLPTPASRLPVAVNQLNQEDEQERANEMISNFNPQQAFAFDQITAAVNCESNEAKCFFIDGPGGSGKTYLYKALLHHFRGMNTMVLPAATTGIAANLLDGGRTMHALFGLPIPVNDSSVSRIKLRTSAAALLRSSKLIIIDECTMASKDHLKVIHNLLCELMTTDIRAKCKIPFGGKVFVLGGDFRQCLPVLPHGTRSEIVEICVKNSTFWECFLRLELINNMRSEDPSYSEWLLKLGEGLLLNEDDLGDDIVEIPSSMLCTNNIVEEIFGTNFSINVKDAECVKSVASRAILCSKNDSVEKLNEEVVERLAGTYQTYLSDDSIVTDDSEEHENFNVEFLNSLTPSGMPSHKLKLKIGCIIMLLRNLNTRKGLCNGTRLIVTLLKNHVIEGKVLTGTAEGEVVFIPRIDLMPSETGLPFIMKRRQFPIKLAFAMTINKSQGQTLKKVGLYLPEPVFGHGQLYVALSRVKKSSDVKIFVKDAPFQGKLLEESEKVFTRNIVYRNVL